ncbi:MAG: ABC transporter permease [Chitinophagales bacterium]
MRRKKILKSILVVSFLFVILASILSVGPSKEYFNRFSENLLNILEFSLLLFLLYVPILLGIRWLLGKRKAKKTFENTPSDKAIEKFIASTPAMLGCITLFYAILLFLFVHLVIPDTSPNANEQMNELSFKPPGYSIKVFRQPIQNQTKNNFMQWLVEGREKAYKEIPINSYKFNGDSIYIERYIGDDVLGQRLGYVMENITTEKLLAEENKFIIEQKFIYDKKFLLGTDDLGRDYLSRVFLGVRVSLAVGFISVFIALCIGIPVGAAAGFYRNKPPTLSITKSTKWKFPVDSIIMWFINVIWAIPTLLLVFPIVFAFGQNFYTIFIAVGLTLWVDIARIVRGQVMQVRELEYIQATTTFGYSNRRTILKHILPNITGPIIVITAANFAYAILIEAGLSFLGIGVQPPAPSWGLMLSKYKDNLITDPYLTLIPGVAITILVLAFFMIGNGVRDALDVKTRMEN